VPGTSSAPGVAALDVERESAIPKYRLAYRICVLDM
jgi:hypothetical protein